MDPILIDVPERLVTDRLVLRAPVAGDGPKLFEALQVSLPELQSWMAWAGSAVEVQESEKRARLAQSDFVARRDLVFYGFVRETATDGSESEGPLVVASGLHRMDWAARRFEIGYWRRTGYGGQGLVDEVVHALGELAFGVLHARRVEIRMDPRNVRSRRVAERCGYTFEGCLRSDSLAPTGEARDTCVFAKVRGIEWRPA
jgi:RimJ/RimL family protein N-acetyltransferase